MVLFIFFFRVALSLVQCNFFFKTAHTKKIMQHEQRKYAEGLRRANPRAEVLEVTYDATHQPWKATELTTVFEDIVRRIFDDFCEDEADFVVRKSLLKDPTILRFQRAHPKLYYVLTDRALMRQDKYRATLGHMLRVRADIEGGRLPDDERGDAAATQAIVGSLLPGTEARTGVGVGSQPA